MAVYTLFGQSGGAALAVDNTDYTMGVQFSVTQAGCTLTGIWFYSPPGAASLPVTIALYAVSGAALVTSQAASWPGAAGSGWVRAPFTSPPALTAAAQYKGCIFDNSGNSFYSATGAYWSTGAGSGGIVNGPLSAPGNAGASPGQDSFTSAAVLTYPGTSFNAANYWVDVEVTAVPAGPVPPLISQRTGLY